MNTTPAGAQEDMQRNAKRTSCPIALSKDRPAVSAETFSIRTRQNAEDHAPYHVRIINKE